MTGTNCIYYERNKDLCVPGKREQWWRRHDGKDVEFVEPGVIPVTVKCNFGEWHLRLPYNN